MSTPERARGAIAEARHLLALNLPHRRNLSAVKVKLSAWETAAKTFPKGSASNRCAEWLYGAGCLCGALFELERYRDTEAPTMWGAIGEIKNEMRYALKKAEDYLAEWEAADTDEEPDEEPESARDRVGGKLRSAALLRACGCLDEIQIATCADAVWRETLAKEAAKPCARHQIETERAKMTDEERATEHARTLEVLTDEWETTR